MSALHPASPAARQTYEGVGLEALSAQDLIAPWELVQGWWAQALQDDRLYEPAAMNLATVDEAGMPDVRTVLLKDLTPQGLTFFTNLGSAKGSQLAARPQAAVVFSWVAAFRQIRARGPVEQVSRDEVAQYWATRPRGSQIASTASAQSTPVASREQLQAQVQQTEERFAGQEVPVPDAWGGFRLLPVEVELWVGMPSRLHDRIQWRTTGAPARLDDATAWTAQRLQP